MLIENGIEIIYEDEAIVVIYKPAMLASETDKVGAPDVVSTLRNYYTVNGGAKYIYLVHRLDQPVEGVMVLAKTKDAATILSRQITDHKFIKKYYAIITRESFPSEGVLEDYMIKDARTNLAKITSKADPRGKFAKLKYSVVKEWDDRRLLEVTLYTGRHHQIRLQLASRTAPILGDVKYGGQQTDRPLALCSHSLIFNHPVTGELKSFTIEPKGEDFSGVN